MIDRAGNVWSINNWKPLFAVDAGVDVAANPGGDGIVIFVGLASPPRATPRAPRHAHEHEHEHGYKQKRR